MPRKMQRKIVKRKPKAKMLKSIPFILPSTHLCKLRYNTSINMDASTGATAYHLIRANDLYDPDATGIGHQPLGFDQLSALYNKFVVLGSLIKCRFTTQTTGATAVQYVGVFPTTDAAISADPDILMEQKGIKKKLLGPYDAGTYPLVTSSYSAKKWWGGKVSSNTGQSGTPSSSPNDIVNYAVWCGAVTPGVSPAVCYANITVEYVVLFKDIKSLIGS